MIYMKNNVGLVGMILSISLLLSACGGNNANASENGTNDSSSRENATLTQPNDNKAQEEADKLLNSITEDTAEAWGICGANLTWYYQNNILAIKGTGKMTEYDNFKDFPWNEYADNIGKIIIQDGCTTISNGAFTCNHGLRNLSSVVIPDSVVTIGEYAFLQDENLISVILGTGLKTIKMFAFDSCTNLDNIVLLDGITEIGYGAFRYCYSISNIFIPDSIVNIRKDAFSGCRSLQLIFQIV